MYGSNCMSGCPSGLGIYAPSIFRPRRPMLAGYSRRRLGDNIVLPSPDEINAASVWTGVTAEDIYGTPSPAAIDQVSPWTGVNSQDVYGAPPAMVSTPAQSAEQQITQVGTALAKAGSQVASAIRGNGTPAAPAAPGGGSTGSLSKFFNNHLGATPITYGHVAAGAGLLVLLASVGESAGNVRERPTNAEDAGGCNSRGPIPDDRL